MSYLLVSDLHCHNWTSFGSIGPNGVNTRLQAIIDELMRAASEAEARGIKTIVIAGDIFHVRGSIDPEVFNPVHEAFANLSRRGFAVLAIPGNHDLKGKHTTKLGNAIQTLDAIKDFDVFTEPMAITSGRVDQEFKIAFMPWFQSYDELRKTQAEMFADMKRKELDPHKHDLIIHAGINGVIAGMPDHGLDAAEVASWGWKRVFAGHYHGHKVMVNGDVVSIGATTHQQWSDIGTRAGFLLVHDTRIEFQASHAPSFIELTADTDPDDISLLVDGNYVRIRGMKLADAEIKKFRIELQEMGAKGVVFQVARQVVTTRVGGVTTSGLTLDQSVAKHIDDMDLDAGECVAIKGMCDDVLTTVRLVSV